MSPDLRPALGRLGERLACSHLERRGLRVLERNYRTRLGEIDVVAADERTLVFCEVKTRRAGSGAPWDSLHPAKQQKVRRMAAAWLSEPTERPHRPEVRFDAIGVVVDGGGRLVALDHLEGAF